MLNQIQCGIKFEFILSSVSIAPAHLPRSINTILRLIQARLTILHMYGASPGLLINDLNFVDNDDSANIYIKYVVPNDEPPGSKSSTVTFWAKSAGTYGCN
mgnify:FL=1